MFSNEKQVIPTDGQDAPNPDYVNVSHKIPYSDTRPSHIHDEVVPDSRHGKGAEIEDDQLLARMGYKQMLFRGLDWVMNTALGFTEVSVLPSVFLVYGTGLFAGGPPVVIWSFIVTFIMTTIISFSMAEICSAYPSAGSVYHWTAQLIRGPNVKRDAPIWSYVCGWMNFLGNSAGDASFANGWASFLSSSIIASGHQGITVRQQVGVSIGVLLLWSLLNGFRVDKVGWINNLAALIHLSSIIVIGVTITVLATRYATGEEVFTQSGYFNATGWHDRAYVACIGITGSLFMFSGYEASGHIAEETQHARHAAPRGLINTVALTGWGGLFVLLCLLFTTVDVPKVYNNGLTGVAAIDAIVQNCGKKCAAGVSWLVVINLFFSGIASVAVTGRITWALFRDKAFPWSDYFVQVHPVTKAPLRTIMFVFAGDCLLLLLPLNTTGGLEAFYAIVALTAIGFQFSYAIPILAKLIYNPDMPETEYSLGKWSFPCGVISVTYLVGSAILFFFPTVNPITQSSMNWVVVVFAGFFFLAFIYWFFHAGKHFLGPQRTTADFMRTSRTNLKVDADGTYLNGNDVDNHDGNDVILKGKDVEMAPAL